ncbi:MAG: helical backbone metal receptor [Wenzhouxiangellaceae bacterium]|nr:helical backbone metal receptor [Wenzhouxiangellaceae bacterium]
MRHVRAGLAGGLLALVSTLLSAGDFDGERADATAGQNAGEARRIVSLAPHLTELAFFAGIGELLVGAVDFSDYPGQARDLPVIGDAFRFDRERIVRLGTTDALAWDGGTPASAVAGLRELGIDVHVIEIDTLDGIAEAIEQLGALGARPERAARRAREFRQALQQMRAGAPGSGPAPDSASRAPIDLFYQVSARPLFTLGAGHLINDVFALCGARNVFDDLATPAASVGIEAVLARDPDAIVASAPEGRDPDEANADPLQFWRAHESLTAARCGNLLVVDPALLVRPTPRVLEGARRLCAWLDDEVRRDADPACRTGRD